MREILLAAGIIALFAYGYYLMGTLDAFLGEKRKSIRKRSEIREPSCLMITEDMPDEKIVEEVKDFRERHEKTKIFLFGTDDKKSVGFNLLSGK